MELQAIQNKIYEKKKKKVMRKKSCWILIWRKCMEQKPPN